MIRQSAGKTKALAYLIGVYIGDGWMGRIEKSNSWNFRLNTIDRDFAEATADAFETVLERKPKIYTHPVSKSSKPNNSLSIGCKSLFWIKDSCRGRTVIPSFIWKSDKESKLEFVAGAMDSEGYVSKRKTDGMITIGIKATDGWILQFKRLMQSLGVIVGRTGKEILPSGKTAYRFHFNAKSFDMAGCYFKINRKQERVREFLYPQRLYVKQAFA